MIGVMLVILSFDGATIGVKPAILPFRGGISEKASVHPLNDRMTSMTPIVAPSNGTLIESE